MKSRASPFPETGVWFPASTDPAVVLQGRLGTLGDGLRRPAVALCHPGATGQTGLEYPVIAACAAALHRAGYVTLRFNFRGVQGSGGARTGGQRESEDVLGAVEYLRQQRNVESAQLYLLGNSFGAWMALEALRADKLVAGVVCIVLPIALLPSPPEHLRDDARPKLLVAAENDQLWDLAALRVAYQSWAEPKTLIVLEGTDHFLGLGPASTDSTSRAPQVADTVVDWLPN